jgi:5-methylcytosine-specific restriction endonuclease McrA
MSASVLQRPTLVLNRNWQPVHVTPVARALTMLWNETAVVVDPDDFRQYTWADWSRLAPRAGEPFLQAVRARFRVPEVLTLTRYDRTRPLTVTFSRRNLFKRDHYTCQYCGARPGTSELSIDHIVPRSRGGVSNWENCVLACIDCNKRKGHRTLDESHMRLRRPPFRPSWRPLYASHGVRIESWSKFLSEAYWNVALDEMP